jgi:hypothetical protein
MSAPEPAFGLRHFRWDVDKTYIRTEFDNLRDLLSAYRQPAEEKENIPGAPALLRALLKAPAESRRVTFISGSPQQMRETLSRKFELDGIEPDEFILKPNLSNILKLRLRAVRHQVGYKLESLLNSRVSQASEFLFGDDSEQDAWIYSVYADMLAHRIGVDELQELLVESGLYRSEVERIAKTYIDLPENDGKVERVFIHLDRRSPVSRFLAFGWRIVPVYNYFQAALVLFDMNALSREGFLEVLSVMREKGYTAARLANSYQDLVRRGYVETESIFAFEEELKNAADDEDSATGTEFLKAFRTAIGSLDDRVLQTPARDVRPDYLSLIERERYRPPTREFRNRDWLGEVRSPGSRSDSDD